MTRLASMLLLLALSSQSSALLAQTTPTPTSSSADRGTAIGTTVRAALTAAFPGSATLVDAVIGAAAARLQLRSKDVTSAKEAAQAPAAQVVREAKVAANDQIAKIEVLAVQLDVVTQFADIGNATNQQLIPLISYMEAHPTITPPEWTANVKSQWEVILATLKPLDGYTEATINSKVRDPYINDILKRILESRRTQVTKLSTLIGATPQTENIALIQKNLAELQPLFSAVARVASNQIQTIASDLHGLAAVGGQGSDEESEKIRKARYEETKKMLPPIEQ